MLILGPLSGPGWGLALFVAGGFGLGAGVVTSNVLSSTFRQTLGVRDTLWIMAGLQLASIAVLVFSPLRTLRDFPAAAARPPLRPRQVHTIE